MFFFHESPLQDGSRVAWVDGKRWKTWESFVKDHACQQFGWLIASEDSLQPVSAVLRADIAGNAARPG